MSNLNRLLLEFVAVDGMSAALQTMTRRLAGMGDAGTKAAADINKGLERMASGWKQVASARELAQRFVAPGLQAAGDQEAALNRLVASTVRGMPADIEAKLLAQATGRATEIAGPTKFNQTEIIDLITDQLRAGLSPEDVLAKGGGAEAAAYLAQSEGVDVDTANRAIVTLLSGFGLAGTEAAAAADKLARFSSASSAGAADINEGLKQVKSAKALGISVDDTLAVLGVLSNRGLRGETGGTATEAFLRQLTVADQKSSALDFYDAQGTFVGLGAAVDQLRTVFGGMTQEQQQVAADKLFGDQGKAVLFELIQREGVIDEMKSAADAQRGLAEKIDVTSRGALAAWDAAAGTMTSTLATVFKPLDGPSSSLAQAMNDAAGKVGSWAQDEQNAKTLSYGAVGVAGAVGALGLLNMARGGGGILKGLSAMSGLGGVAAGVAEGKALEAATGVAPVFVTNWPASMGGLGGMGAAAAVAGGMGGLSGIAVTSAALSGWGIGTAINENLIKGTAVEDAVQAMLGSFVLGADMYTGGKLVPSELVDAADQAQDRFTPTRMLKEMLGLKVTVNVDQNGEATVLSEGVENLEVAANRRGGT